MIKKIPFNPVTAMAAWQFPSEDGVFFQLYMRDGTPVQQLNYYKEAGTRFPFIGQYWRKVPGKDYAELKSDIWQTDGRNLSWMTSRRDLVLYRGTLKSEN